MIFNQHDTVVLTKAVIRKGEYQFPVGSIGTIVHHHPGHKAYEVAFIGGNILASVKVDAMRPEYTCVYCGCTDSKACADGCHWIEQHQHTPTGVCSNCNGSPASHQRLDVGGFIFLRPAPTGKPENIWMQRRDDEGMEVEITKLEAQLEKFFRKHF